jgi:hypothetical protein
MKESITTIVLISILQASALAGARPRGRRPSPKITRKSSKHKKTERKHKAAQLPERPDSGSGRSKDWLKFKNSDASAVQRRADRD